MKVVADHFVSRFVKEAAKGTGLSYIINFYSYAIVGNTMQWVEKGMPEYRKADCEYLLEYLVILSEVFENEYFAFFVCIKSDVFSIYIIINGIICMETAIYMQRAFEVNCRKYVLLSCVVVVMS